MADVEKVARATLVERLKAWRSLLAANHYTEKVALLDEALAAMGEREAKLDHWLSLFAEGYHQARSKGHGKGDPGHETAIKLAHTRALVGAGQGCAGLAALSREAVWPASHPLNTSAVVPHETADVSDKPVAWMRRWAADKIDVMALKKAERPGGWHLHATTEVKLLADDVPLYASPRPEAVEEAVKAERERCARIADEHAEAWGTAMASPAIVIAAAIRSGT